MKKMNNSIKFLMMAFSMALASVFISCDSGDDPIIIDDTPVVADGLFVVGSSTKDTPDATLELAAGNVDIGDFSYGPREGLYETYIYLNAGTFNLALYSNNEATTYGGAVTAQTLGTFTVNVGALTVDGAAITVTEGFYHISVDFSTNSFYVIEIANFEILGAALEGWNSGPILEKKAGASAAGVVFEATNVVIRSGQFKIRYNSNWNIDVSTQDWGIDATGLNFFTNFGSDTGVLSDPKAGASNFEGVEDGAYTVRVTYTPGKGNSLAFTISDKTDIEPLPEYPAELYMVGSALDMTDSDSDGTPDGWQWTLANYPMVPVNSQPHLFWKIAWLEATGEFKFAPQRDWIGDFGKTGDATDGVYAKGSDNTPAPATSGYYMVVVNLATNTIEVNEPLVYGIGDAFGSWDKNTHAFTVDNANHVIKFDNLPAAGDLRMHVNATTLTKSDTSPEFDWWQAEFVILDGQIAFRGTGGDQVRAAVTAGQSISLDFKAGTGAIQ